MATVNVLVASLAATTKQCYGFPNLSLQIFFAKCL